MYTRALIAGLLLLTGSSLAFAVEDGTSSRPIRTAVMSPDTVDKVQASEARYRAAWENRVDRRSLRRNLNGASSMLDAALQASAKNGSELVTTKVQIEGTPGTQRMTQRLLERRLAGGKNPAPGAHYTDVKVSIGFIDGHHRGPQPELRVQLKRPSAGVRNRVSR